LRALFESPFVFAPGGGFTAFTGFSGLPGFAGFAAAAIAGGFFGAQAGFAAGLLFAAFFGARRERDAFADFDFGRALVLREVAIGYSSWSIRPTTSVTRRTSAGAVRPATARISGMSTG